LGGNGGKMAVEPLILALKDKSSSVRNNAAITLGKIGDKQAIEPLTHLLRDKDEDVRRVAEGVLKKLGWNPPPSASSTPLQTSTKTGDTEPRILYVKWPKISLREGPGTEFKSLLEVIKGTALMIMEEKGQWIRVSLEDGRKGWIGKATTSETP